jgi:hypothetical protein
LRANEQIAAVLSLFYAPFIAQKRQDENADAAI